MSKTTNKKSPRSKTNIMKKNDTTGGSIQFPPDYRVVGADLSLKRPGFCQMLIHKDDTGLHITQLNTSSVDNKTKVKPHGLLLDEISKHATALFIRHKDIPTFYVREKAFNSRGAMSEIGIFKVVGVTELDLFRNNGQWQQIYPVTVKKNVTGSGKADKNKVQQYLKYYVGQRQYANDDESDAVAVAIAWLIQQGEIQTVSIDTESGE